MDKVARVMGLNEGKRARENRIILQKLEQKNICQGSLNTNCSKSVRRSCLEGGGLGKRLEMEWRFCAR